MYVFTIYIYIYIYAQCVVWILLSSVSPHVHSSLFLHTYNQAQYLKARRW